VRVIAGVVLGMVLLSFTAAPAFAAGGCESNGYFNNCEVENSGSQIDIGAGITNPGTGDGGEVGGSDESGDTGTAPVDDCFMDRCDLNYTVVGLPDVTLADLVSFVPARPILQGEPAGLGVVGMPTNLVATASAQLIPGRLLDYDVIVQFTPAAFRFDYGDGTGQRSTTGGSAWSTLGQAQFTPTSTSHAYAVRGTYGASVTVLYSAAVDFGAGRWRPVAGYVEATTGGYDIRVVEARTALVDRTCVENPSGPGC
jgi:hypothetical protein